MFPFTDVLITGGAGFVGSNLALRLKEAHPASRIVAADNLKRRGSELNISRLKEGGVEFVHCDIRNPADLDAAAPRVDLLVECSAEPSVLAGIRESPDYLVATNLHGTANCLELARRRGAAVLFLSTSRVYPLRALNSVATEDGESRFLISPNQVLPGISLKGVSETFPLPGARSLYGATKLASELLVEEYGELFGLPCLVDRCSVIAGPWQMGKVDQGVFSLWVGKHLFGGELSYVGWGGAGKQVRDLLHIDDLAELIEIQLSNLERLRGGVFNVGGGASCSLSLAETTSLCVELTGRRIPIRSEPENRPLDVKLYISDNSRIEAATGWRPKRSAVEVLRDIYDWMRESEAMLRYLWT